MSPRASGFTDGSLTSPPHGNKEARQHKERVSADSSSVFLFWEEGCDPLLSLPGRRLSCSRVLADRCLVAAPGTSLSTVGGLALPGPTAVTPPAWPSWPRSFQ